jgi:hypothetical protein
MMSKMAKENYERMRNRLLESVKIRCKECKGVMIRVVDLYEDTVVGYSCKNCTHHYLFDDNVV